MLKATIYIIRKDGNDAGDDDIIRFYEDDEYRDMIRVKYSTPDLTKDNSFYLSVPNTLAYLNDMFKTFRHDSQPFEYVQVSTSMHPSILYHVSDLDDADIRHLIEDTVEMALRRPIFRVKRQ